MLFHAIFTIMANFVKDYNKFDVESYLELYFQDPKVEPWCMEKLHTFWKQFESKENIKLLEFGGGPNISRLISACHYVTDIVFCEYIGFIRKAVEDWNDNKGFDWKASFDYIVKEIEGKDEQASNARQQELRNKLKAIIPCDITATEVLDISSLPANLQPPYDVLFTSYCLEAVVQTNQEYKESVAKLSKLVKPGGLLVMHGALSQTYYKVGKYDFYSFPLSKELIQESVEAAGCEEVVVDVSIWKEPPPKDISDMSGEFFVIGKKK